MEIRRLVPFEVIEKVAEFRRVFPDEVGLKPIFEFYDGAIPYGQIRAALEWLVKG